MAEPGSEPLSEEEAREATIERMREVHNAYLALFGPPGKRTPFGAIVLKDLERFARYRHTALYRPKIGVSAGVVDAHGTIYNLALHEFVRRIHACIERSEFES